jgi:hypothetical protein
MGKTILTIEQYLEVDGSACPKCRSKSLAFDELQPCGTTIFQNVTCYNCKAYWTDQYILTAYSNFHEKDPDE